MSAGEAETEVPVLEDDEEFVARAMTLEEWADLDEDVPGEWADGFTIEGEMPSYVHELILSWLNTELVLWARKNGARVAGSGGKFGVSESRGRMPDLTVYFRDQKLPPREGLIRNPPSIAVEIVSPRPRDGRRDRVEKMAEYAAFGVAWYWLLDRRLRSLEIFRLGSDGHYAQVAGFTGGTAAIPGCDGLVLDLTALWSEIDSIPE